MQMLSIVIFWIPAHRGIPGNETADALVKQAARDINSKRDLKVPFSDALKNAKDAAKNFREWLKISAAYKGIVELYQDASPRIWFHGLSLSREEIVITNRICSNHYNLNASLYRKGIVGSPACPCGDPFQDINHVLFTCPNTSNKASYLIDFLDRAAPGADRNIFSFLKSPKPELCRRILACVKSMGLRV